MTTPTKGYITPDGQAFIGDPIPNPSSRIVVSGGIDDKVPHKSLPSILHSVKDVASRVKLSSIYDVYSPHQEALINIRKELDRIYDALCAYNMKGIQSGYSYTPAHNLVVTVSHALQCAYLHYARIESIE